jgi:hypothetical protein
MRDLLGQLSISPCHVTSICTIRVCIIDVSLWNNKKVKIKGGFGLSTGHVVDCDNGAFIDPVLGSGILTE